MLLTWAFLSKQESIIWYEEYLLEVPPIPHGEDQGRVPREIA